MDYTLYIDVIGSLREKNTLTREMALRDTLFYENTLTREREHPYERDGFTRYMVLRKHPYERDAFTRYMTLREGWNLFAVTH